MLSNLVVAVQGNGISVYNAIYQGKSNGVSKANEVLRNHYHPPGATPYIEKRVTNQSY